MMECHNNKQNEPENEPFTVEPVVKRLPKRPKIWSIIWSFSTGGLLTQVNYKENYTFLINYGFLTQVVLSQVRLYLFAMVQRNGCSSLTMYGQD